MTSSDEADRQAALSIVPVSRETEERLATFADRLRTWQRIKNLVASSTLETLWTRHIADSAQLLALAPEARRWVDLGSGAGLPGLVIAIMLADVADARVHLIESNARKCAFLRDAIRSTGAAARVYNGRVDEVLPGLQDEAIDVVTSRALAPVVHLVRVSRTLLDTTATGLFLTGEMDSDSDRGLITLPYRVETIPSRTHTGARIVRVSLETDPPDGRPRRTG